MVFESPEQFYTFIKSYESQLRAVELFRQFLDTGDALRNPGTCGCAINGLKVRFNCEYNNFKSLDEPGRIILKNLTGAMVSLKFNNQIIL